LDEGVSDLLTVDRDGAVAVLTINRPAKRNAMTAGMWAALPGVSARRPTILASAR
jgi:enoyl-CoA hydratase/carnithine racemase